MHGTYINIGELNDSETTMYDNGYDQIRTQFNVPEESGMVLQNEQKTIPIQPEISVVPSESLCVQMSRHCNDCPVCSKLYRYDTTYYNYSILFLLLICILLIKNVLSKR